jgi:hypothetical protein
MSSHWYLFHGNPFGFLSHADRQNKDGRRTALTHSLMHAVTHCTYVGSHALHPLTLPRTAFTHALTHCTHSRSRTALMHALTHSRTALTHCTHALHSRTALTHCIHALHSRTALTHAVKNCTHTRCHALTHARSQALHSCTLSCTALMHALMHCNHARPHALTHCTHTRCQTLHSRTLSRTALTHAVTQARRHAPTQYISPAYLHRPPSPLAVATAVPVESSCAAPLYVNCAALCC